MIAPTHEAPAGDRRYSARWQLDRAFPWRAHGGRRVRQARVVERSLNGLVLESEHPGGTLRVGAMIHPGDEGAALRHGYRLAIVRRVESLGGGRHRVVIEILA